MLAQSFFLHSNTRSIRPETWPIWQDFIVSYKYLIVKLSQTFSDYTLLRLFLQNYNIQWNLLIISSGTGRTIAKAQNSFFFLFKSTHPILRSIIIERKWLKSCQRGFICHLSFVTNKSRLFKQNPLVPWTLSNNWSCPLSLTEKALPSLPLTLLVFLLFLMMLARWKAAALTLSLSLSLELAKTWRHFSF